MKETLNKMIDWAYDYASQLMISTKNELLTQFVLMKEDGFDMVVCPWSNDEEKEKSILLVGLKIIESEETIKAYSMISEVWMLTCQAGKIPEERPSQSAHRTEAIVAVASDAEDHLMHCWKIGRDTQGRCVSLAKDTKPVDGFESWMVDALDRALLLSHWDDLPSEIKRLGEELVKKVVKDFYAKQFGNN